MKFVRPIMHDLGTTLFIQHMEVSVCSQLHRQALAEMVPTSLEHSQIARRRLLRPWHCRAVNPGQDHGRGVHAFWVVDLALDKH